MTVALIVLCAVLVFREISFMHERKRWETERKDLYTRIQAGTLQEYKQATAEPVEPIVKDREQRVAEEAKRKGLQRTDLQYPPMWKG